MGDHSRLVWVTIRDYCTPLFCLRCSDQSQIVTVRYIPAETV